MTSLPRGTHTRGEKSGRTIKAGSRIARASEPHRLRYLCSVKNLWHRQLRATGNFATVGPSTRVVSAEPAKAHQK